MKIEVVTGFERAFDTQIITLEQIMQRRIQRRRRVAKRMAKRFPLFAVEMMQNEFPGYTEEEFIADVTRKTRKGKSFRRPKSQLFKQGRYPLYENALSRFSETNDVKDLEQAQYWRNRLYLPFEVEFKFKKERKVWTFPSTTPLRLIEDLSKIKFQSWEELDEIMKEKLKWSHLN